MTHIVVSNASSWDPQSLGVVGVLKDHRDFRSFCDEKERLENNSVPYSLHSIDDDVIHLLVDGHEMSSYFDGVMVEAIVFPDADDEIENDIIPNIYIMVSL